jgi:hypothetical protein
VLPKQKRDKQRAGSRTEALDDDDLPRVLERKHPGAVVFQTPAKARRKDKQ